MKKSIKKNIILSLIAIFTILISINSVKAEDNYLYVDYDNSTLVYKLSQAQTRIDTIVNNVIDVYENQGFTFDLNFVPFTSSTKYVIKLSIHKNEQYIQNYNNYKRFDNYTNNIAYWWNYINFTVNGGDYYTYNIDIYGDSSDSSFNSKLSSIINDINNYSTSFTKYSNGYVYSGSGNSSSKMPFTDNHWVVDSINTYSFTLPYYSTSGLQVPNFTYSDTFNYKLVVNNIVIDSGNKIPTYISKKSIDLTYNYANDLEGTQIAAVKADFKAVYNNSYTYQIKTDYTDWIDITSDINTASESGYYYYNLTTYNNTNVYARVLDNNNTILYDNSIYVDNLADFDMIITHNPANDLNGLNVEAFTFDLRNCWNSEYIYQYSYDNIIFYNMEVSDSNKLYNLNMGIQTNLYIRIMYNNSAIYTKDITDSYGSISKTISVKQDYSTDDSGNKIISAIVDYSNYNQYKTIYGNSLRFYINGSEVQGDTFIYTITKDNYLNFNLNMEVWIDNSLVDSSSYAPSYGDLTFDDKYNEIVEDKLKDTLGGSIDYSTPEGMQQAINNFFNAIKSIIIDIFKLIFSFFNKLNIFIQTAILTLLITIVFCKVIEVIRKQ